MRPLTFVISFFGGARVKRSNREPEKQQSKVKRPGRALARVAQLVILCTKRLLAGFLVREYAQVAGSYPDQGAYQRQLIDVSLSRWCFSLYKINNKKQQHEEKKPGRGREGHRWGLKGESERIGRDGQWCIVVSENEKIETDSRISMSWGWPTVLGDPTIPVHLPLGACSNPEHHYQHLQLSGNSSCVVSPERTSSGGAGLTVTVTTPIIMVTT